MGVIVRWVTVQGVTVLGGNCPGGKCPVGKCPGVNVLEPVPPLETLPDLVDLKRFTTVGF